MTGRADGTTRVTFVSAEFAPVVKVGGLGEASAGLVAALRAAGVFVEIVIPDYDGQLSLENEVREPLAVQEWATPAFVRRGTAAGVGPITLIGAPGIERPHPYSDPSTGEGWDDNNYRFFAFSAAVAALIALDPPDVVHLNDWHTSAVASYLDPEIPIVLTIHNAAHQGTTNTGWVDGLGQRSDAYLHLGAVNPLAGGIRLADAVVAVSPSYATELLTSAQGCELDGLLAAKGESFIGIRNGIDHHDWNPTKDAHLTAAFSVGDLTGKQACRKHLLDAAGMQANGGPVIGMVSRLAHQKGIDLALSVAKVLPSLPARLVIHGSGSPSLAHHARVAADSSRNLAVLDGYSDTTAHQVIAGSDLILIPSRFEPCGLTQMQAMSYGTIPVVTNVGGLSDTVIDLDQNRHKGTGFIAARADTGSITRTLCRAINGWRDGRRRSGAQRRGMGTDWSWTQPAANHIALYEKVVARHSDTGKATK